MYPRFRIPIHPQPSIFETTEVTIADQPYTFEDYTRQRKRPVRGDLDDLHERAYAALLAKGWVPTRWGFLVNPKKYPDAPKKPPKKSKKGATS